MLYDDKELYKELLELLRKLNASPCGSCPVCGNDLAERYNCEVCPIDHMSGECFHDGKHKDNCLLIKHTALVEIDIETSKTTEQQLSFPYKKGIVEPPTRF